MNPRLMRLPVIAAVSVSLFFLSPGSFSISSVSTSEECQAPVRSENRTDKGKSASEKETDALSSYYESWAGSGLLDHFHARQGVDCFSCHGTDEPEERAPEAVCMNCHGSYEDQAELTEEVYPNPHKAHLGNIRCTLCHKAHQESTLYCNQCHEYDLIVP